MKKLSLQKGFTLIELLIVITIIGILAVALLPSVLGAPSRARDAARKADIGNIIAALETYNSDNQTYPQQQLCLGDYGAVTSTVDPNDFNQYFQGQKPPVDPQKGSAALPLDANCQKGQYLYCPLTSPLNYFVAAYMEIPGDGNTTVSAVKNANCNSTPALMQAANGDAAFVVTK